MIFFRISLFGGKGVDHGGKLISRFPFLPITFHMKQVSLKSDHYCGRSLFGENVFPPWGQGVDHGEKIISWFSFLTITFHMKQVSLKSDHYCKSSLFGGNAFPPWGKGGWPWGKTCIIVFISHLDLPYETSFT